jgi:hypothetical protein
MRLEQGYVDHETFRRLVTPYSTVMPTSPSGTRPSPT